jgi:integrase/recombinase XerD
VQGVLRGIQIRKSLDLVEWEAAQATVREWESVGIEAAPISFAEAKDKYLTDVERRNLASPTEKKYKLVLRQLSEFAIRRGIILLRDLGFAELSQFLSTLEDGPLATIKKIERLRNFFSFCQNADWISKNPAKMLKPPKATQVPTLPFSQEEVVRLIEAAIRPLPDYHYGYYAEKWADLLTFVLLLRFSGLRISDVALLHESSVSGRDLRLRQLKNLNPVTIRLPEDVADRLHVTKTNGGYYFVSGSRKLETVTNNWRRKLDKLFVLAKVENGHAHRFRDTFAVEHLLAGSSMEDVQKLLGHKSIKTTEKHYAPWNKARQDRLNSIADKVWDEDRVLQNLKEIIYKASQPLTQGLE